MAKVKFLNVSKELNDKKEIINAEVEKFMTEFKILETDGIHILLDARTNAFFCECHISARDLIDSGTIDVPLDPDSQPDYRANREANIEHTAFQKMVEDSIKKRTFSNIVCEYNHSYQKNKPIKILPLLVFQKKESAFVGVEQG